MTKTHKKNGLGCGGGCQSLDERNSRNTCIFKLSHMGTRFFRSILARCLNEIIPKYRYEIKANRHSQEKSARLIKSAFRRMFCCTRVLAES